MINNRITMRYVHCPVCGKNLMKIQGASVIEVICPKCKREIIATVDLEKITVLENRRGQKEIAGGEVSVSINKGTSKSKAGMSRNMAMNYE